MNSTEKSDMLYSIVEKADDLLDHIGHIIDDQGCHIDMTDLIVLRSARNQAFTIREMMMEFCTVCSLTAKEE